MGGLSVALCFHVCVLQFVHVLIYVCPGFLGDRLRVTLTPKCSIFVPLREEQGN